MATPEKDDRRSLLHRNAMYNFEFDDFTGNDVDMNEPMGREEERGGFDKTLSIKKATASLEHDVHGRADAHCLVTSSLRTPRHETRRAQNRKALDFGIDPH
ncbi:hypothetical protein U1Q18_002371 [Sarracenia purpurea var. burkii]